MPTSPRPKLQRCNLSAETNVKLALVSEVDNQAHQLGALRRLAAIANARIPCLETVCRLHFRINLVGFLDGRECNHCIADIAMFLDETRDFHRVMISAGTRCRSDRCNS